MRSSNIKKVYRSTLTHREVFFTTILLQVCSVVKYKKSVSFTTLSLMRRALTDYYYDDYRLEVFMRLCHRSCIYSIYVVLFAGRQIILRARRTIHARAHIPPIYMSRKSTSPRACTTNNHTNKI